MGAEWVLNVGGRLRRLESGGIRARVICRGLAVEARSTVVLVLRLATELALIHLTTLLLV
uniref:Uncharacterized protein n=1 Tax=viral metagenome TaxID=1070528 RepID=A0A6M3JMP1_9ZZZZ